MRVILDTNILVSALLVSSGSPARIYRAWIDGDFTLLTSLAQLDELRATLRKPALAERIRPYHAGRLINELRNLAELPEDLPRGARSPDPAAGLFHAEPSGCSERKSLPWILAYDGRFRWWPTGTKPAKTLRAHQAQLLLAAGNPTRKPRRCGAGSA